MSTRRPWTAAEKEQLAALYPDTPLATLMAQLNRSASAIYGQAATQGLSKSKEFLASTASGRLQRGDEHGVKSRFKPGHEPHNKGTTFIAGGRSANTQFKKGQKPHTWNPIGHIRTRGDGYLEQKLTDTGITRKDYKCLHTTCWESVHGPVPAGSCLVFRDGNKLNICIENIELVTRSELMRRNTIHRLPPEVKECMRLVKKIKKHIGEQNERQDD